MKQAKKSEMDVKKRVEEIKEQYSLEDIQKFYHELDQQIRDTELLEFMCKELDEKHLSYPYCGCSRVHKNGKTPQGVQRYKCKCKKTFILRHNALMYHSHLSKEQWNIMLGSTLNNDSLKKWLL